MKSGILVIDDDEIFRRRLVKAFSDRGFCACEAGNSNEALESIRTLAPEMAVLDLKLGDESGILLLKQLKAIAPQIAVVVLTGYGTIATTVEALKLGAINYLTKPVDADTVLAAFSPDSMHSRKNLPTPPLAQIEWDHIQRVVNDFDGNISHASKALGLHRRSLQRKLNKPPQRLK